MLSSFFAADWPWEVHDHDTADQAAARIANSQALSSGKKKGQRICAGPSFCPGVMARGLKPSRCRSVDLTANLAAGESGASHARVNVRVGRAGAHRVEKLREFTG